MKKEAFIALLLVSIILFSNLAYAEKYSSFGRFKDNIRLFFAKGDNKVRLALEIREKEINSAIDNAQTGNQEEAVKNLEDAKEKLKLVQENTNPEVADEIKLSIEEIEQRIMENKDLNEEFKAYLENHLSEEEKTKLSADLSEKLANYCNELAKQDFSLLEKDERCNPENAPSWLKKDIEKKQKEMQKEMGEEMINQLTTCINDPRECECSKIPVVAERQKCEKATALAIRCEFQEDMQACNELEKLGPPRVPSSIPGFLKPLLEKTINELMEKKEAEMFNKFAPKECIEANARTREECEKIMIEKFAPQECIEANARTKEDCEKIMIAKYGPPPTECMENGEFIGEEACNEKMIASGKIPQECIRDNKPIPREECEAIMQEKGLGIPLECIKDGGFIGEEECEKIMQEKGMQGVPEECIKEGQPVSPEDCEKIMEELGITPGQPGQQPRGGWKGDMKIPQECVGLTFGECEEYLMKNHMPKDCLDANALTPEACRKVMLPQDCKEQGLFTREECDAWKMKKNMPQECMEKNINNPEDCAKILSKNIVKASPGSELDFLERQGVSFDEIPSVCKQGSNFVRGMECDNALSGIGVTLPPPVDISTIPKECVRDGVPVTPQECQEILKGKIVNENIPQQCRESEITNPDDCARFMEKDRRERGIGVNMPPECMGKSPEECKKIMEEKGIQIPQPRQAEMVCREGDEECLRRRQAPEQRGEAGLPRECMDLGISDSSSCGIVMSRINEERMKNGDKMILKEGGEKEFITNEELNMIAEGAERRAEEIKPDLEQAQEIRQDIIEIENNIQQIEQRQEEAPSQEQPPQEQPPIESPPAQEQPQAEQSPPSESPSSPEPAPSESPPVTGEVIISTDYNIIDRFFDFLNEKLF